MSEPMSREGRERAMRGLRWHRQFGSIPPDCIGALADAARRYLALTAPGDSVVDPNSTVVGTCLACAHVLPLAVWDARLLEIGVCAACLELMAPNRGGCSHTRGCDCTQDGVSWRIRDAESASKEGT